ncbi:MAG: 50S ribosomal protein L25 [Candidatus Cohnella colombiensis]|uniref:Large ribosomal subunit protein bL25 n=1 Tax=Candidatus Cohnella colombiensis TaxID=3121368 RepID=A0AA95EV87_9BACL|nr:MAG: 50S ribosomal protein L25 [Cohnella sp.]
MIMLQAKPREHMNRSALKRLRTGYRLPGIIFGAKSDNIMIDLSAKEFQQYTRTGDSGVLEIELEGKGKIAVLLEDVQRDPVTREYIHVDFLRVNDNEVVRTKVTVEYTGTANIAKLGGVIQIQSTLIEIEALPANIPSLITVDLSDMNIGESLVVGNLDIPAGVSLISSVDEQLVSIIPPKAG